MDFEITVSKELESFRDEVADFLRNNVPTEMEVLSTHPEDYPAEQEKLHWGFASKLGSRGWLYPTFPKEYGGGGLTVEHSLVIEQELGRYGLSTDRFTDSGHLAAPSILVWGTEDQKQRFVKPILRGEVATWQLLTEPHGGTDLASAKTTAIRDGDEYVINGQKVFVGDGREVDQLWTIVLTDPDGPRHQNLSWIMVPTKLPGITIHNLDLMISYYQGSLPHVSKCAVFFDNVRVPVFNLIGGENNGWKVGSTHLELEHGGGGVIHKDRIFEALLKHCKETELNGRPMIEDPDIKDILSEMYVEAEVVRLFGLRNYWLANAKQPRTYEGPQSSVYNRVHSRNFALAAQKMLGHYAVTSDRKWAPIHRWLEAWNRGFFTTVHAGGSLNIMKLIVARRLGAGRTVKEEAGELP